MWIDGEKFNIVDAGQKLDIFEVCLAQGQRHGQGTGRRRLSGIRFRRPAFWGAPPKGFDVYYDDIAIDTKRVGPVK